MIGETVKPDDCSRAESILKANQYEISEGQFNILWSMLIKDGWTKNRLEEVISFILKNHPYKTLKIADFYQAGVTKLYTYLKVRELINAGSKWSDFEAYDVNGSILYSEKFNDIPFPAHTPQKPEIKIDEPEESNVDKNWAEFFKHDKDWNKIKSGTKIKTEKRLTKTEFLKQVGAAVFTEELYKNYLREFKTEELSRLF